MLVGGIAAEYNPCGSVFLIELQVAAGEMTMRSQITLAGLILLATALTADSQVVVGPNGGVAPGGWWSGGTNFASTPQEGWARGQADLIRAQADAYETAARGAISYEQARTSYMENRLRWHQIALQRQQMGEEQRANKAAAERAARERRQATAVVKPPERLSDSLYDRTTGVIQWPELLMTSPFAEERALLDQALKLRAHTGDSFSVDQQILNLTTAMLDRLKSHIREVPSGSYLEARKVLDLLGKEMRQALG
jgi:hypothetical protein